MSSIDYGKIITIQSIENKEVTHTKHEYELSIFSTKKSFLTDVIEAMKVISDGSTKKVTLEIKVDDKDRIRIKKRWLVSI